MIIADSGMDRNLKYAGTVPWQERTAQQGDAPLGHRLQPEKVPGIRPETFNPDSYREWDKTTCFGNST